MSFLLAGTDKRRTIDFNIVDKYEVFIKVPQSCDVNALKRLKTLLTENLGDQTAYLVFTGKKVKLPFSISWNETLAKEISSILENGES